MPIPDSDAAGFLAAREAAEAARRRYEDHDPYTMRHSVRVAEWAVLMGRALPGFGTLRLRRLEITALLHDFGKTFLDGDLIRKPGGLTPSEWFQVRRHPELGAGASELPAEWVDADGIRYHHKHFDGTGYPEGPERGYALPLEARLIAVADVFDALTSRRAYRAGGAYTAPAALDVMDGMRGRELDPGLVVLFRGMYDRECRRAGDVEIGAATLQLRSVLGQELDRARKVVRDLTAGTPGPKALEAVVQRLVRANLDPVSARTIGRKVLGMPLDESFPTDALVAAPERIEPEPGSSVHHREVVLRLARLPEGLNYAQVVVFEGHLWLNVGERAGAGFEVRLAR